MPAKERPAAADPWHALELPEVLRRLEATAYGLSSADAAARLSRAGPNAIPAAPPVSRLRVLAEQTRSVIVLLLAGATVLAVVAGEPADAAAVAVVLILNVAIGYSIEIGAHRAVEALARLEARSATVIRDGVTQDVDPRGLVPGDVLVVEEGQDVAADARLLSGAELRVNESSLTGESRPVTKSNDGDVKDRASLAERKNMLHAGTSVVGGRGRALIVATGGATELGRIGALVNATRFERTPLERRLDTLGRQLVWIALGVGGVMSALAWWQRLPVPEVIQTGIALAVAAVPEGLPAVATITLALAVRRMARRRALVRRLPSVETLGAVTVICTDKTGTLTAGVMIVTHIRIAGRRIEVTGFGYEPEGVFTEEGQAVSPLADPDLVAMLRVCVLANHSDAVRTASGWTPRGDPTEAALVVLARKAGMARVDLIASLPEVGEVPFSSSRKLMATFHRDGPKTIAFVKGAPERVLPLCASQLRNGSVVALGASDRRALVAANQQMALGGDRVLALAFGHAVRASEQGLRNLVFAGLVGMSDPPAPGVKAAIRTFAAAGVRTVMVTGDQAGTAAAVAYELGLADATTSPLEGEDIDALSDATLAQRVRDVTVFSRVSPEAKLRLVSAFQANGEIVAMVGDGVNDAAALKKADVGVTMGGRGTDAAREVAAVVLQDDRFQTIGTAIEEGRIVFDNIRKFVFYLFSCNLAEIIVLLGAAICGLPTPLLPIQILWLNLVTDTVPALSLAVEPAVDDVMRRPPRDPGAGILSGAFLWSVGFYGVLIALPVLLLAGWNVIESVPADRAMTMNFLVLSFAQLLHLGNARDDHPVVRPRRILANPIALVAVGATLALQGLTIVSPTLRQFLHLVPLSAQEWLVIGVASAIPAIVGQLLKASRSRMQREFSRSAA